MPTSGPPHGKSPEEVSGAHTTEGNDCHDGASDDGLCAEKQALTERSGLRTDVRRLGDRCWAEGGRAWNRVFDGTRRRPKTKPAHGRGETKSDSLSAVLGYDHRMRRESVCESMFRLRIHVPDHPESMRCPANLTNKKACHV